MAEEVKSGHDCEDTPESKYGQYGPAISNCWSQDGELWVGNDEYANQVNFCPFCGSPANVKVGGES
jgi:hypothetical protein